MVEQAPKEGRKCQKAQRNNNQYFVEFSGEPPLTFFGEPLNATK